ncbi:MULTISPECIES: hypothetical protein [unclassified Blastococcus]|nr:MULTISPECIES: hypothetical protein [unclassified Blastococcus]
MRMHLHQKSTVPPVRCFKHHVWMAACSDCRAARAVRPSEGREQPAQAG